MSHDLKVGDELAFECRGQYQIYKIKRITPTGRIKCGPYDIDPDLRIRGRTHTYFGPFTAEIVSDKIRCDYFKQQLLCKARTVDLKDVSIDTLKRIVDRK